MDYDDKIFFDYNPFLMDYNSLSSIVMNYFDLEIDRIVTHF